MVVGDAAGQVNPLTGEGIIPGMIGGMCAGQVAAQAIKEDCSKKFLKLYDEMARKELDYEGKGYNKGDRGFCSSFHPGKLGQQRTVRRFS